MPNATVRANARTMPVCRTSVPTSLRRRMEAAVERLIAAMDDLDGDPDLEDSDDAEPSLGSTNHPNQTRAWADSPADDLEFEGDAVADCDLEEQHDREDDEAERSGIGDLDGLIEQIGREPWFGAALNQERQIAGRRRAAAGASSGRTAR